MRPSGQKKATHMGRFKEAREGGKSGKAMQDGVPLGETTRDKLRMKEEGSHGLCGLFCCSLNEHLRDQNGGGIRRAAGVL
jgi:hypothetical protein